MKVRSSILGICALAIVVFVLAIWFAKRPTKTPDETRATPNATEQAPSQPHQQEVASPVRTNAKAVTHVAPPANGSPPSPTTSKMDQAREVLSSLNDEPIVFYGKLEDQFGNPVAGAEITGNTIIYNGQTEGVGKAVSTSDTNGLFTLDAGRGERLGVMPRKPGYALASLNGGGVYSHLWSEEERQHPDPNNPVVIKMWKLQGAEVLVNINQRFKFHYTDAPVNFDLLAGKIVPTGGDIKITIGRASGTFSLQNPQDWSVKIESVDGGLMDSSGQERITYWAPEAGYQSSRAFFFSTNAPHKWFDGFTQGFFVVSRNGRIYSKLGLSFSINRSPDDLVDVTFEGVANTNGSRNWEGDSNTYKPQ